MANKKIIVKRRKLTPFGKAVRKKLIDKGMSQRSLEQEIGAPYNYLSAVLYGQRKGKIYVERIGEYLNIDVSKYA